MSLLPLYIILQLDTGGPFDSSMLMILAILLVFYFFMIRPQMTKAKKERQFKEGISKGDKVVTIGGVHGKVTDLGEGSLTLEVAPNIRLKVEKSAVSLDASKQYKSKEESKK